MDLQPQFQSMSLAFEVERIKKQRDALEADNVFLRGMLEQVSAKNLELESRLLAAPGPAPEPQE